MSGSWFDKLLDAVDGLYRSNAVKGSAVTPVYPPAGTVHFGDIAPDLRFRADESVPVRAEVVAHLTVTIGAFFDALEGAGFGATLTAADLHGGLWVVTVDVAGTADVEAG